MIRVTTALFLSICLSSFAFVAPPAQAASPESEQTADAAVDWLKTQQQPDGGFELAGSAGFETPDAVLALAEHAQPSSTWNSSAALAAVTTTVKNGNSPLHYLDDLADGVHGPLGTAKAAELVIVVKALGLDPAAFDPDTDGAKNLTATLAAGANPDGSYGPSGQFNATLLAVIAQRANGETIAQQTIDYILGAQQAGGGWMYSGDPANASDDPDTTGRALQALAAAGVDSSHPAVTRALAYLAKMQAANGGWEALGDYSPNATDLVVLGITALGFDVNAPCWRDAAEPSKAGTAYVSPEVSLRNAQAADGHIAGPFDFFGLNTSGTSQTVQALLRGWMPVGRAAAKTCSTTVGGTTTNPNPQVLGVTRTAPATIAATGSALTPLTVAGITFLLTGGAFIGVSRRRPIH